jgi:hypothetical protein
MSRHLRSDLIAVPAPGAVFVLLAFLLFPLTIAAPLRAQEAPPGAIARVEGLDVSVEGGTAAGSGTATVAPSIFVANGSVITVHSGMAQMTLLAGGEIDICGPAKLTLLESGTAVTLALNFGRLRVQLPAVTSLRIFTPTIIATPLDIGGAARDITVGLDLRDSLCVLASSGALKLEQQFTGEDLIVPQAGEFFLAGGKLSPVAGTSGTCQCEIMRVHNAPPPPPIPERGLSASSPPILQPSAADAKTQSGSPSSGPVSAAEPDIELSVLAHGNDAHPETPKPKPAPPPPAPLSGMPEYKIDLPAMTFSASSPHAPPDPTADMALVIRYARVEPDWQFTGHVEAPQRLPAAPPTPKANSQPGKQGSEGQPSKKKPGFWSRLRHIFGG